jgi:Family of unknown function (DUF5767)
MDDTLGLLINPDRTRLSESAIAQVRATNEARNAPVEPDPSFEGSDSGSEQASEDPSESESEVAESEAPSSIVPAKRASRPQQRPQSREDLISEKTTLLFKLDRLEKMGETVSKRYTLSDDIYELRTEVARLEKNRNLQKSIKFQRSLLVSFSSGLEFMNTRYDPIGANLEGWSETVHDKIDEYDDVFAELAEKYSTSSTMPPELKLVMLIVSSAFMCHLQNTMFKKAPQFETVMKSNPGLARDFAAATAKTMAKDNAQTNPLGGGLAAMMGGMFSQPAPRAPPSAELEEIFSEISNEDSVVQEVSQARAAAGGGSLVLDL